MLITRCFHILGHSTCAEQHNSLFLCIPFCRNIIAITQVFVVYRLSPYLFACGVYVAKQLQLLHQAKTNMF
jgi:hypothetical protein